MPGLRKPSQQVLAKWAEQQKAIADASILLGTRSTPTKSQSTTSQPASINLENQLLVALSGLEMLYDNYLGADKSGKEFPNQAAINAAVKEIEEQNREIAKLQKQLAQAVAEAKKQAQQLKQEPPAALIAAFSSAVKNVVTTNSNDKKDFPKEEERLLSTASALDKSSNNNFASSLATALIAHKKEGIGENDINATSLRDALARFNSSMPADKSSLFTSAADAINNLEGIRVKKSAEAGESGSVGVASTDPITNFSNAILNATNPNTTDETARKQLTNALSALPESLQIAAGEFVVAITDLKECQVLNEIESKKSSAQSLLDKFEEYINDLDEQRGENENNVEKFGAMRIQTEINALATARTQALKRQEKPASLADQIAAFNTAIIKGVSLDPSGERFYADLSNPFNPIYTNIETILNNPKLAKSLFNLKIALGSYLSPVAGDSTAQQKTIEYLFKCLSEARNEVPPGHSIDPAARAILEKLFNDAYKATESAVPNTQEFANAAKQLEEAARQLDTLNKNTKANDAQILLIERKKNQVGLTPDETTFLKNLKTLTTAATKLLRDPKNLDTTEIHTARDAVLNDKFKRTEAFDESIKNFVAAIELINLSEASTSGYIREAQKLLTDANTQLPENLQQAFKEEYDKISKQLTDMIPKKAAEAKPATAGAGTSDVAAAAAAPAEVEDDATRLKRELDETLTKLTELRDSFAGHPHKKEIFEAFNKRITLIKGVAAHPEKFNDKVEELGKLLTYDSRETTPLKGFARLAGHDNPVPIALALKSVTTSTGKAITAFDELNNLCTDAAKNLKDRKDKHLFALSTVVIKTTRTEMKSGETEEQAINRLRQQAFKETIDPSKPPIASSSLSSEDITLRTGLLTSPTPANSFEACTIESTKGELHGFIQMQKGGYTYNNVYDVPEKLKPASPEDDTVDNTKIPNNLDLERLTNARVSRFLAKNPNGPLVIPKVFSAQELQCMYFAARALGLPENRIVLAGSAKEKYKKGGAIVHVAMPSASRVEDYRIKCMKDTERGLEPPKQARQLLESAERYSARVRK